MNFWNHDDQTASFYFTDGHAQKRHISTVPLATDANFGQPALNHYNATNSYFWGARDFFYHRATGSDKD